MEDIRKVAKTLCEKMSDEDKKKLWSVFKSMGKDKPDKVSLQEFEKHSDDPYTRRVFKHLVGRRDGLKFEELFTLGYITLSRMPFCAVCENFIPGLFFTCTQCRLTYPESRRPYGLCIDCYLGGKVKHKHAEFKDNYTLLSSLLDLDPPQAEPSNSSNKSNTKRSYQPDLLDGSKIIMKFEIFTSWLSRALNGGKDTYGSGLDKTKVSKGK